MTDTPEMFGGELRILAAVDFADGKIVRWVDYWDASAYDSGLYGQMRAPADRFPRDMQESKVATTAPAELTRAPALHGSVSPRPGDGHSSSPGPGSQPEPG